MNKLKAQRVCGFLTRHKFKDRISVTKRVNGDDVVISVIIEYKCNFCGKKIYENDTNYSTWRKYG